MTLEEAYNARGLATLTFSAQCAGDEMFLTLMQQCVTAGGGIKLLDRDGNDLGTFQRPEAETPE